MIHIRGCWLDNNSGRSRRRAERARLEESKRVVVADLSDICMHISDKREARLIQTQQYRQQGGD